MRIHWHNVFAALFLLAVAVILLRHPREIGAFLDSMNRIGPGHTSDDRTLGLIAFGIMGVLIVAIVRLLTSNRK